MEENTKNKAKKKTPDNRRSEKGIVDFMNNLTDKAIDFASDKLDKAEDFFDEMFD